MLICIGEENEDIYLYNIIKIFRVTMDPQYNEEQIINSGEQFWDCRMVYESPQTGWKIEGFGH